MTPKETANQMLDINGKLKEVQRNINNNPGYKDGENENFDYWVEVKMHLNDMKNIDKTINHFWSLIENKNAYIETLERKLKIYSGSVKEK